MENRTRLFAKRWRQSRNGEHPAKTSQASAKEGVPKMSLQNRQSLVGLWSLSPGIFGQGEAEPSRCIEHAPTTGVGANLTSSH